VVPTLRLIGRPDPCFGWDGEALVANLPSAPAPPVEGAYAGLAHDADVAWVARDPLGLGKLFWARSADEVVLAARPAWLTERGHPLDECHAIPPNTIATIRSSSGTAAATPIVTDDRDDTDAGDMTREDIAEVATSIRDTVSRYVGAVLAARPGPVVVCLSGGLDSTSIAALVREHRDDAVAVTFDLDRPGSHRRSDDFAAAQAVARHLGLTLVPALHPPARLFDLLDTVLVAGIDWRDFNVHAGLVNAGLAVTIADLVGPTTRDETTVLTGDLVNELLADYRSETYRGQAYYPLPRLPLGPLRASLVRGLQTGHREIGVFVDLGLTVVQPYAAARADFLRLPDAVLGPGPGKRLLYEEMFGDALPRISYERPKTRAQTGSADDLGVLAACVDAGIDAAWLARRFAQLHGVEDLQALGRFLRAGRYRSALPRGDDDRAR